MFRIKCIHNEKIKELFVIFFQMTFRVFSKYVAKLCKIVFVVHVCKIVVSAPIDASSQITTISKLTTLKNILNRLVYLREHVLMHMFTHLVTCSTLVSHQEFQHQLLTCIYLATVKQLGNLVLDIDTENNDGCIITSTTILL